MELIIKLYSDKPSKIGVKYPQEYSAVRAYEEIFSKNRGEVFSLKIEMIKDRINLVLVSDQSGGRILYKELEYKMEQLKKLETYFQPGNELQFVHIFPKSNTLMIAKPFRTQKFISLSSYEIIGPANFVNAL